MKYDWDTSNAYKVVRQFEQTIADYAGAKHGVAVDSCTNALFLCLKFCHVKEVVVPKLTWRGVAMAVYAAGGWVKWSDTAWSGTYRLSPYPIVDSALRFRRGMYEKGTMHCLSFHASKHLNIGRGGMILTDDADDAEKLRKMAFDGRKPDCELNPDEVDVLGYHMFMQPAQAAEGLTKFIFIKDLDLEDLHPEYPDISRFKIFRELEGENSIMREAGGGRV